MDGGHEPPLSREKSVFYENYDMIWDAIEIKGVVGREEEWKLSSSSSG